MGSFRIRFGRGAPDLARMLLLMPRTAAASAADTDTQETIPEEDAPWAP